MKQNVLLRIVAALMLVAVVTGCVQTVPVTVEQVDVNVPSLAAQPAADDWPEADTRSYPRNSVYRTFGGAKLVANSGAEIEMLSGSTLDIQSGATTTFGSGLEINGDITLQNDETIGNSANGVLDMTATAVRVSNFINHAPQTPILIANDGWLTPTGTFQGIYAAGAIGFSRIYTAGYRDGDMLLLYNLVAQTIVITDENDTNLTGNITLTIGDSLGLVYTNTAWWQTSTADN